jgi:ribosomal protein S18 acetylase RimI-like enzyme
MGAVVRAASPADLGLLAALETQRGTSVPDARARFARDLDDPRRMLVVAEHADEIRGYGRVSYLAAGRHASARAVPEGYYLGGLFVSPALRRDGIGLALTHARMERVFELSDRVWYFANAQNTASIALHERVGFQEVTRRFEVPGVTFEGGEGVLFVARRGLR